MDLRDKHADDDFGKQYSALPSALQTALIQLDVTEYFVSVGDMVDKDRMTVTESIHSETAPVDTVIESIMPGLELKGNVVRPALCVASLGPESVAGSDDNSPEGSAEEEEPV